MEGENISGNYFIIQPLEVKLKSQVKARKKGLLVVRQASPGARGSAMADISKQMMQQTILDKLFIMYTQVAVPTLPPSNEVQQVFRNHTKNTKLGEHALCLRRPHQHINALYVPAPFQIPRPQCIQLDRAVVIRYHGRGVFHICCRGEEPFALDGVQVQHESGHHGDRKTGARWFIQEGRRI